LKKSYPELGEIFSEQQKQLSNILIEKKCKGFEESIKIPGN